MMSEGLIMSVLHVAEHHLLHFLEEPARHVEEGSASVIASRGVTV